MAEALASTERYVDALRVLEKMREMVNKGKQVGTPKQPPDRERPNLLHVQDGKYPLSVETLRKLEQQMRVKMYTYYAEEKRSATQALAVDVQKSPDSAGISVLDTLAIDLAACLPAATLRHTVDPSNATAPNIPATSAQLGQPSQIAGANIPAPASATMVHAAERVLEECGARRAEFIAVPCKPIFFDLAANHLRCANLDERLAATTPAAGKGIRGFVRSFWGWRGGAHADQK